MTLDEKLDWIAKGIMHIINPSETPYSTTILDEYIKLFEQPKPEPVKRKLKGLFLKDI